MHPRAIETRYAGYRFRSRLEARWAVFFDALGLKWEYEPEGFELPGGVRYLPDFLIRSADRGDLWCEVKPTAAADDGKAVKFAAAGHTVALLVGPPEKTFYAVHSAGWEPDEFMFQPVGSKYAPAYFSPGFATFDDLAACGGWESEIAHIARAIDAARGARFEHGESGGAR